MGPPRPSGESGAINCQLSPVTHVRCRESVLNSSSNNAPGAGEVEEATVTVAWLVAAPPAPLHVTLYVVFVLGDTAAEPDTPEEVKPLPVHEVAFVEDHVSVEVWPAVIAEGDALSVAVKTGAGGEVVEVLTVTFAEVLAEPPAPVQVSEYVVVVAGVTIAAPDIPEAVKPLPVHEVAFVEFQVSVDELPTRTESGLALRVTVGAEID